MIRRGLVIAALALSGGCVADPNVQCGAVTCPADSTCVTIANEVTCASIEQVTQCEGLVEGNACIGGVCHGGACIPAVCGDGRVELAEQCDPPQSGACSNDCTSNFTCGNGVTDVVMGEGCDDGNRDAHDGCDESCRAETPQWIEVTPSRPPPTVDAAMAYDTTNATLVMFGGSSDGGSSTLGDTWLYVGNQWRRVHPLVTPSPRSGASMAYDGATHRVYMFGGRTGGSTLDELWSWDGLDWHFEATTGARPPARQQATFVYDAHRQRLVLHGGQTGFLSLGDTWEFDGAHWTAVTSPGPEARYSASAAYDPASERVVMFGGFGDSRKGTIVLGDTWTYDGAWHAESPTVVPAKRAEAIMVFSGQRVILGAGMDLDDVGGITGVADNNVMYEWMAGNWVASPTRLDATRWGITSSFVQTPDGGQLFGFGGFVDSAQPTVDDLTFSCADRNGAPDCTLHGDDVIAMSFAPAALDLRDQHPIVYGADEQIGTAPTEVGETMARFASGVWQPVTASDTIVGKRKEAAFAYDTRRRELVLFGGNALDDPQTYAWNGAWRIAATSGPPARSVGAMAYDAGRGHAVMFGGYTGLAYIGDTWLWDGTSWTEHPREPGDPTPRSRQGMAYDPIHGDLLMFGGEALDATHGEQLSDELWRFDETGWHLVPHPPGALWPSPRELAGFTWDPARKRILLFGGLSGILEQDTWEWDGIAWQQVPVTPPPPRLAPTFVGTSDGVVLAGGALENVTASPPIRDVWVFRYQGIRTGSRCRSEDDDDNDGLAGCEDHDCWLACQPDCAPGTSCDPMGSAHCGDGMCGPLEALICPADCTPAGVCGDGECTAGPGECAGDCP